MKIGILIKDFHRLSDYELRIISAILDDPDLELALLIKDGREDQLSSKSRITRNLFTPKVFANALFAAQLFIERKLFKPSPFAGKDHVIKQLVAIPSITLSPQRKGFLDVFSKEDSDRVKNYDLDIILRHQFRIIRGEILHSARHGIWSFHHGDNDVIRGGPSCFWEIVQNEPYVGVTLQQLTKQLDGGLVIDKAKYNWHWSYYKTDHDVHQASVELLMKNINRLKSGPVTMQPSSGYNKPIYKKPGLRPVLKYLGHFYSELLSIAFAKLRYKLSGTCNNCWTLWYGEGNFPDATLTSLKPFDLPRGEFWADPFLYRYNGQLYVFFENYSYDRRKGKISCAKITDGRLHDVTDALELDCHLSYPFIVEEDGNLFMIPETGKHKRLEVYKCTGFPGKWELYATAFEGEVVADATYFNDDQGQRWLLLNKGIISKPELYIYRVDSLKLQQIEPHALNPVRINTLNARNAGAFFKYNGAWYRPSQVNAHSIYGRALNLNKVVKLSLHEFEEETVTTITPDFADGLVGIHHVHQLGAHFVFDACFKRK